MRTSRMKGASSLRSRVSDDLLRDSARARRRAVRQDGRLLRRQSERDRHRRAARRPRPSQRDDADRRAKGTPADARPASFTGSGHVPGRRASGRRVTTETFESVSPATGEVLGAFPKSGAAEVGKAVDAAKAAYEEWRLVPAPKRGEILFRFAQTLEREKAALTDLMTHEMGKVKAEAGGDVQEAIDMTYYMAGEGRRMWGQTTPSELRDKFNMSVRVPVGVVGAITPWNFPIAIPSWKTAPALVCGNTVVLKPAEDTPLLAQRFVDLLHEAGLPEGVVQIVHGFGEEAGDALVRHPDVPVITSTGPRETGVAVTKAAAA